MKDISERIVSLGDKFMGFNITSGYIYALINLPKKWSIPSEIDDYNVKSVADNKSTGTYFFTEIVNGVDKVFDAIDYTISVNIAVEEKMALFTEKVKELKEIFAEKDINYLKGLTFKYQPQKKTKKKKEEPIEENKEEMIEEAVPVPDQKEEKNNAMLDIAKEIVGE